MVPSSRNRIPDANIVPKQEPDNDVSLTAFPAVKQPTFEQGNYTRASTLIPDYSSDSGDGYDSDAGRPVNESVKHMGPKRSRFQKQPGSSSAEGLGSVNVTQTGPNNGKQDITPRKRGRPAKNNSLGISSASMSATTSQTKSSTGKRKRGVAESSLRRSSRAAAGSATKQITEQSMKRPKAPPAPSSPSTPRRKKATSGLNTGSKRTLTKTPTKTPAKEYEVEHILATRRKAGTTEYLVQWKGYHVKDNTWEPAVNLTHCAKALKEFRAG